MWKQFVNKLPGKSSSSGKGDRASGTSHRGNATGKGGTIQRTSSCPSRGPAHPASSVKRMSSAVFPSNVVTGIEPLVSFKEVPNREKQTLFLSKVSLCCVVFDFSDPNKNSAEKDFKRQALLDLVEYVDSASSRFTETMVAAYCRKFAINLFRVLPLSYRTSSSGGGEDEEEPLFDPACPHLHLVYDLLQKLVGSSSLDAKLGKKYFDHSFIVKLLELFNSEDPRERDCLKTILHMIYGKFMAHRPFIRKAVSNIFYHFVFETSHHNGIVSPNCWRFSAVLSAALHCR
jgi:serine/threonine-protein phosphatase 2A regulatory subunit B'